jgi:hypothetical protein
MKIINITNPDQEPVSGDFVRYEYDNGTFTEKHFYKYNPTEEQLLKEKESGEREWRDRELASTDFIVPLVDHPKHSVYMTYRQELRDYPNQADFPNGTRPVKP